MNDPKRRNPGEEAGNLDRAMEDILSVAFQRRTPVGEGSGPADAPPAAAPPERLGDFRLLEELGRGGMGVVYLAEDTRLGRKVAIKVLTAFASHSRSLRTRLLREAEVASKLDHPAICKVFEVGEADGVPFIAMQYVEGETLAGEITARRAALAAAADVTPSPSAATRREDVLASVHTIEKVARALQTAHDAGLVHRDVKPGNIMVTRSGEPVLLDFGLARDVDAEGPTLTQTGQLMGTPAYMAPEQLKAERGRIDRRADVYGLGVTLYECLTTRRPFEAPTREQLYAKILASDPPDPRRLNPSIPKDLKVVLETALEKDLNRRYQTAEDFAEDLRRVRALEPITARPVSTVGQVARWARRRPAWAALLVVLAIALPALAALGGFIVANLPAIEKQERLESEAEVEELLNEAYADVHPQNWEEAVAKFDRVLARKPDSIEAVGGKALALLWFDREQECLGWLDALRELFALEPALLEVKVRALRQLGRDSEAAALEARDTPPLTDYGHYLTGALLMKGCPMQRDPAVFRRAADAFTKAILSADPPHQFYWIQLAHAAGHLDDEVLCRTAADALTRLWPDSFHAHVRAAFALMRIDPRAARAAAERAIELKPGIARPYALAGGASRFMGEYDRAIEFFEKTIALIPERSQGYHALGTFYVECEARRNLPEAIRLFRKALERVGDGPNLGGLVHCLGRALKLNNQWEESTKVRERQVKLAPDDPLAHVCLGECYLNTRRFSDALRAYERAVELDPDFPSAWFGLARARQYLKQYGKAVSAYEKAEDTSPGTDRGREHPELGPGKAAGLLRKGERIAPARIDLRRGLALAACCSGQWKKAIVAFTKVLEIDRDHAQARGLLGSALLASGEVEKAIEQYRRALELKPDWHAVRRNLGAALVERGEFMEAVKVFEDARRVDPSGMTARDYRKCADAWLGLARKLNRLGRFKGAADAAEKAIALRRDAAEPHFEAGWAHFRLRQWDQAAIGLTTAIKRGLHHPGAYCYLGLALVHLGQLKQAHRALRRGRDRARQTANLQYPTRTWVEACARLLANEPRLDAVIRGGTEPGAPRDALVLAKIAFIRKRYGPSAAFYEHAFDGDPGLAGRKDWLLGESHRYSAACAAGLAGFGRGADASTLDESDRARWRKKALDWLAEERAAMEELFDLEAIADREEATKLAVNLEAWKVSGLGLLRRSDALASLSEEERSRWAEHWAEVDRLLARVRSLSTDSEK